jgi:chitinase
MITYDSPESTKQKIQYITEQRLGGAMWWESSGDKSGPDSLIDIVYQGLKDNGPGFEKWQNELDYPQSIYENVKNKMNDQ